MESSTTHTIESISKTLTPVFFQYNIKKAIVFGSYAKKMASENSDIDILIDSAGTVRGFKLLGLMADIKEVMNTDIDLFEAYEIIPDSIIDREIKQTGVVIYENQ